MENEIERFERLELEELLLEIKKDLISYGNLKGSQEAVVLAISGECVVDFSQIDSFKKLMIDVNFMNIHIIRVDIPSQYARDRLFIKHQIVAQLCIYFDIISRCFEEVKKNIFPYQHKLVNEARKKQGGKMKYQEALDRIKRDAVYVKENIQGQIVIDGEKTSSLLHNDIITLQELVEY